MQFKLSFKGKLYVVITLALFGFMLLSTLSFNVLKTLDKASNRVDAISQKVNLLKDLQIDVLHLHEGKNADALQRLLPKYEAQLNQLIHTSSPQQVLAIKAIQKSLTDFINSRLFWLVDNKRIGSSAEFGLRADMAALLQSFEKDLFSNFRPLFSEIKQSFISFMDQRGEVEYQQMTDALDRFRKQSIELEFDDFYGEKLAKIDDLLNILSSAVFSLNKQGENAAQAYLILASEVTHSNQGLAQQLISAQQDAKAASTQAKTLILGVGIAVALLVVGLLVGMSRNLVNSLDKMSQLLHKLSEGDLTQKLEVNQARSDELDKVGIAVNDMTESLNEVLNRVTHSSQTLDEEASDLSKKLILMVEQNTVTNDQADSVAAATEQISSTIQNMVCATDIAQKKTQLAQESAEQGGDVITSAITSLGKLATVFDHLNHQVGELDTNYRKVDGVTEMINGLAEQTNLLALNAAIEAARAGDAGRGFSVVADEVRGLAEKTVQATQNINDIIGAMHGSIKSLLKAMREGSEYVDSGKQLGDKAAFAVAQIKTLVLDVNLRNQELAISIDEASKATQVIADNMDQVANNVTQNKEQSQDVLDYVGQVGDQAKDLLTMTGKFKCE